MNIIDKNGKICGTRAPKHTGAKTTYPHGPGTCLFWGICGTNFSIYTTKMEDAGPQILGTGAKFKRGPCQKSCRVNRAFSSLNNNTAAQIIIIC